MVAALPATPVSPGAVGAGVAAGVYEPPPPPLEAGAPLLPLLDELLELLESALEPRVAAPEHVSVPGVTTIVALEAELPAVNPSVEVPPEHVSVEMYPPSPVGTSTRPAAETILTVELASSVNDTVLPSTAIVSIVPVPEIVKVALPTVRTTPSARLTSL